MSKQLNFYATEDDKIMIAELLHSVFEEIIDIPYEKGLPSVFNPKASGYKHYLTEKGRQSDICYRPFEYYDGVISDILDYRRSPVLEYYFASKNEKEDYYIVGRFYSCSEDAEFSKKVSNFFTKFKKEFWYVKKWKIYISKRIDIENSLFFIPNRIIRITKEDLV
jgi:hypothetical protein